MTKKEKWPKHMMGKQCGYQLHEDGSLTIAPSWADRFDEIEAKRQALDEFLASIARVSQAMADDLAAQKRKFWKGLTEEYSLDVVTNEYDYQPFANRIVTRTKKASP